MTGLKKLEELLESGKVWSGEKPAALRSVPVVSFGLPQVDKALAHGGLIRGSIHEFCTDGLFKVPLSILSALAVRSGHALRHVSAGKQTNSEKYTVWIGRTCWPNPLFLRSLIEDEHADKFFARSLFLHPPDKKKSLWAVEYSLRSPAVHTVVAALPLHSLSITRRLVLAAESTNALGLIAVAESAARSPSAAATRWRISRLPSTSSRPRFTISLLKQKGGTAPSETWICEFEENGETISPHIPADVVSESRSEETAAISRSA